MRSLFALAVVPLFAIAGCRSAYVETTVSNQSSQTVRLIEVDYPSASFGTQALAPGAAFHYRFQVIGDGKMKITYTDAANKEKSFDGPYLKEGAAGPLTITLSDGAAKWEPGPHVASGN